jgi:hypothetical protein
MLYSKIKFEININNDELLETIWEHTREVKRGVTYLLFNIYYTVKGAQRKLPHETCKSN